MEAYDAKYAIEVIEERLEVIDDFLETVVRKLGDLMIHNDHELAQLQVKAQEYRGTLDDIRDDLREVGVEIENQERTGLVS